MSWRDWFKPKAGALNTLLAPHYFASDKLVLTKRGDLFAVYKLPGIDFECKTDEELESVTQRLHTAVRNLNPAFRIYRYAIKTKGVNLAYHRAKELYSFSFYFGLLHEVKPNTAGSLTVRQLELDARMEEIENHLSSFESATRSLLGLERLNYEQIPHFLGKLTKSEVSLPYSDHIDYWAARTPILVTETGLYIDAPVRTLTLRQLPRTTKPNLFSELLRLPCDLILCDEFKRIPNDKAIALAESFENHYFYKKDNRNARDAADKARKSKEEKKDGIQDTVAIKNLSKVGELKVRIDDGEFLGEYSLTLVISGDDLARASAEAANIVGNAEGELKADGTGSLDAYLSVIPGNTTRNLRRQWNLSMNYADLAPVYGPAVGDSINRHLGKEALCTFETTFKTAYAFNLYEDDLLTVLIFGVMGSGKCLAKGTEVIMYDGSLKRVEDIKPGDLLMGPDSAPRVALNTCYGTSQMYRVTPTKGESYVVNEDHILSLQMTDGIGRADYPDGSITNISVKDYLSKPLWWRNWAKGYRVGVDFPNKPTLIDPYFLGLWLGDGTECRSEITTGSPWTAYSGGIGKHIPEDYKANSRDVRLQVLAGLIDSDGSLSKNCYDITLKSVSLAEDLLYLARSLGFAAYKRFCSKTCTNNGKTGHYLRISISGNLSEIPVRIERKKASQRIQKKSVLRSQIRVEPIGQGDYAGFMLDKDGLFLLKDFTVTHNSFLTNKLIADSQKYDPFTFILDIGNSYRQITEEYRGEYLELGKWKEGFAPFSLERTPVNLEFLSTLVHSLLEVGGYHPSPRESRLIDLAVRTAESLSDLDLPLELKDGLYNWTEGRYAHLFNNRRDGIAFADFQTIDFQGVRKQIMGPVFLYIFHLISLVVYDPKNLARMKQVCADEPWKFVRDVPSGQDHLIEAGKTFRKHNGGIILTTQSALDYKGGFLDAIKEICTTRIFLANPVANKAFYKQAFDLNDRKADVLADLTPKKEFLLDTPTRSARLSFIPTPEEISKFSNDPESNLRRLQLVKESAA